MAQWPDSEFAKVGLSMTEEERERFSIQILQPPPNLADLIVLLDMCKAELSQVVGFNTLLFQTLTTNGDSDK